MPPTVVAPTAPCAMQAPMSRGPPCVRAAPRMRPVPARPAPGRRAAPRRARRPSQAPRPPPARAPRTRARPRALAGREAVRDDRRLECDDRATVSERLAHLCGDGDHRLSSMSMNSTSPNCGKVRTCLPVISKPAREYTAIARALNAATARTMRSARNRSRAKSRPARTKPIPCPRPVRSGRSPRPYSRTSPRSSKESDQRPAAVANRKVALRVDDGLRVAVVEVVRRLVTPLLDLRERLGRRLLDGCDHGIAPSFATHRAAASRPSSMPPTRNPAASASPAPVESTTSTVFAAYSVR